MTIDLTEARAVAVAARADTSDGLTAREQLPDVVEALCDTLDPIVDPVVPPGVEWGNRMRIDGRVREIKRGHRRVAVEAVELGDEGVTALLRRTVTYGPWVEVPVDAAARDA